MPLSGIPSVDSVNVIDGLLVSEIRGSYLSRVSVISGTGIISVGIHRYLVKAISWSYHIGYVCAGE